MNNQLKHSSPGGDTNQASMKHLLVVLTQQIIEI